MTRLIDGSYKSYITLVPSELIAPKLTSKAFSHDFIPSPLPHH